MGRIYTVPFQGTVTAAGGDCDLFELVAADDKPIRLLGFSLGQTSEVGDTAEEGLRISVIHLPATFTTGSGGSTVTPVARDPGISDLAAGFTAKAGNTTVATTSGTATVMEEKAWNERNSPYDHWYPGREYCPMARQAAGLVVRMQTTAADDFSFAGTAWVEEE